jgi:TatD DNase family protein
MLPFINLHTHQHSADPEVLEIHSILPGEIPEGPRSVGLHPWYLDQLDWAQAAAQLEQEATRPEVMLIGEAGLDKLRGAPMEQQIAAFEICIGISERLEKPLILHCVRAFNEILVLKKKRQPRQAWIFHGFQKNLSIARQCLDAGAYLSFGTALLRENHPVQAVFREMPAERIFLETDDQPADIRTIYATAAQLRGYTLVAWQEQIQANFKRLFSR